MNGAESLVCTLVKSGVDTCFANPGTSEIHLVQALDRIPEIRCVLGLFEGVVTGAADGYARMAQKPACTLLHLGPGLGNGIANLHNASRAQVPILNVVGQHATHHLENDTPLCSDIEGIARPYSRWLRTSQCSSKISRDAAEAVASARSAPGQISTLIVPADVAWSEGGSVAAPIDAPQPRAVASSSIERALAMLRSGVPTAILLSGDALSCEKLKAAGCVAAKTGAKLFCPYPLTRLERGAGLPAVERVMYVLEQGVEQFKPFRQLILVGAQVPMAYFAYPGKSASFMQPDCAIHELAAAHEDRVGALQILAESLGHFKRE